MIRILIASILSFSPLVFSHMSDDMDELIEYVDSKEETLKTLAKLLTRDSEIRLIRFIWDDSLAASKTGTLIELDSKNCPKTIKNEDCPESTVSNVINLTSSQIVDYTKIFKELSIRGISRKNGIINHIIFQNSHKGIKDFVYLIYPPLPTTTPCTAFMIDDYETFENWKICRINLKSGWSLEHYKMYWKY